MRLFVFYIGCFLLLLGVTSCDSSNEKIGKLEDFVPQKSELILKIANFETFKNDLKRSALISSLNTSNSAINITSNGSILSQLNTTEKSVLSLKKESDSSSIYTWATPLSSDRLKLDSIPELTIENKLYKNKQLLNLEYKGATNYATTIDSIFVLSSSEKNIQEIIDGVELSDPTLKKLYQVKDESELNLLLKTKPSDQNPGSHLAVELAILPNRVSASGVILAKDSVPQLLDVFKGQLPQQNDISKIIPSNSLGATIFAYSDAEGIINNLLKYNGDTTRVTTPAIFESINEVGQIEFESEVAIVLKSIDSDLTLEALSPIISEHKDFREVQLFTISETEVLKDVFAPLANLVETNYLINIENFFVFTNSEGTAEKIISAYKNNATLAETSFFQQASLDLSNASSLLYYRLKNKNISANSAMFPLVSLLDVNNASLKDFPFATVQYSYDRDFAHVNMIATQSVNSTVETGAIKEEFSTLLDQAVLGTPQFFTNHRTKGKDIVVQDIGNTLYLISSDGKILWSKQLEGPIMGAIHEVDILRNGKKQLAFNTKKNLHVLDRNGKKVGPFPLDFKDEITQPLSVFDYDNNRKYRFLITQGEAVYMYDSKGKIVTGFTFKKAASPIVQAPQHIRMNNKDYIVIAEENGNLNILSRVGKQRIKVSQKFDFSEIPIRREGSNFVVITNDKQKKSISQTGKITIQPLEVADGYSFITRGTTKVTLDDNLLRINGKLVELPFGIYTAPTIHIINRKTYIAVTETQENKVYLYGRSGNLVNGFPIYGISHPDVSDATRNKMPNVVVQGGEKEIILYSLQ